MNWNLIIVLVTIGAGIFFAFGGIAKHFEAKDWNGGVCKGCGRKWKYFDTDSQGGRGYKCGNGHVFWASYKVDKVEAGGGE